MIEHLRLAPGSPAWLSFLSASQWTAAAGLSPYVSRRKLWRQMKGGDLAEESSDAITWGIENEATGLRELQRGIGEIVIANSDFYINDRWPWAGCTPDGFTESGQPVEVKCPFNFLHWLANPQPTLAYLIQCQVQMAICEQDFGYLIVWTPPLTRGWLIHRNETFFNLLRGWVEEFLAFSSLPPAMRKGEREKRIAALPKLKLVEY